MTQKKGHKILHVKKSFKKEFKRQLRLALIAAIGFTIAFSWRNAVYNSSKEVIKKVSSYTGDVLTEFYTAIFITLIGVVILLTTSKFLKDKK